MKIDCYDACSCEVIKVPFGDTFYHDNILHMRVSNVPSYGDRDTTNQCWAVRLDTGDLIRLSANVFIRRANCKVVVDD